MSVSPEFRRNLWLEITPYRLISMPLVLGAVFYLAFVSDDYQLGKAVSTTSAGLFFLIAMIWGTKLASESIMNEIRDHTWDNQRMSVITPWQLTWGKLLGSTVYTWCGAVICIAVYGLSVLDKDPAQALKTMLVLLLSGVLAHAVSLLTSLMALQKERKFNKSQTAAILLLGIVAAGPFFNMALNRGTSLKWFGVPFAELDFLLGSTLAYTLWAVVGVYQMIRLELQMKNSPWVWFGFVLFVMLHIAGLFHGTPQVGGHAMAAASPTFLAAYFVSLAAVYFMAFAERKDALSLRAVVRLAAAGNWPRFLERAPRWLLTLPITAGAGVAVIATGGAGTSGGVLSIVFFVCASLLFLTRDLGIMLFCNLGTKTRRADMLTVLCLVLLYGIFPATLAAMKIDNATLLFWPRADLQPLVGCMVAGLETIAMGCLVAMRWKKRIAG